MHHYSHYGGLYMLRPEFFGTGYPSGEFHRKMRDGELFLDRVFLYLEDTPERDLASVKQHKYVDTLPQGWLDDYGYDLVVDVRCFKARISPNEAHYTSKLERLVHSYGYAAILVGNTAQVFVPVPVKEVFNAQGKD